MESRLSGDVAGPTATVAGEQPRPAGPPATGRATGGATAAAPSAHFASPLRDPGAAPEITPLTGLRAVAAVWVVVDHFQVAMFALFPSLKVVGRPVWSGYLAIEVFFLLSGFILAYNYAETVRTKASYKKFLWARVARIYPLYLLTCLIMMVAAFAVPVAFRDMFGPDFPINAPNAVANLFLLGSFPPFVPFDPPSWSLTCEFIAYFLFPVLAWATLKLSPRAALAWMSVVLALGILAMLAVSEPGGEWPWSYEGRWIRIATEFTAGMLLWRWWRNRARPSARWDLVAIASALVVLVMVFAIDPGSPLTFTTLPIITLMVAACASATGPLGRLLGSAPLQKLGELSYSLYLSHIMVLFLAQTVLPWKNLVDEGLGVRLGWMLMTVAWMALATVVLYHCVEKPSRKRMLAWYARRHAPVRPAPAATDPA